MATSYHLQINLPVLAPSHDEFARVLQAEFAEAGIPTSVGGARRAVRSTFPVEIVLAVGSAIAGHMVGRYFFDPAFDKAETLVAAWIKTIKEKMNPFQPFSVTISFTDMAVTTYPYILSQTYLLTFWEHLSQALRLLKEADALDGIKQIRFWSESIDQVNIIAYHSARPSYIVDIAGGVVKPITSNQASIYTITDNAEEEFRRKSELEHKLYIESIERMKRKL